VRFEWDARKAAANAAKHGVTFETGALVFDDPRCLFRQDRIDETGEQRWHAIGAAPLDDGSVLLLVAHVYRRSSDEEEIVRIFSARTAGKDDVGRYQEQAFD
jgi:uncharacterized DUF497 family protein